MPVRGSLKREDTPGESDLRAQIENELRTPRDSGEPVIVIQRPHSTTTHLFVIWSRFENVDQVVRSRIILDAFRAVQGEDEALTVTVSMGLTPAEAERMGIG